MEEGLAVPFIDMTLFKHGENVCFSRKMDIHYDVIVKTVVVKPSTSSIMTNTGVVVHNNDYRWCYCDQCVYSRYLR